MLLKSTSGAESLGTTPRAPSCKAPTISGLSTLSLKMIDRTGVPAASSSRKISTAGLPDFAQREEENLGGVVTDERDGGRDAPDGADDEELRLGFEQAAQALPEDRRLARNHEAYCVGVASHIRVSGL